MGREKFGGRRVVVVDGDFVVVVSSLGVSDDIAGELEIFRRLNHSIGEDETRPFSLSLLNGSK